jgi:hypothetical protein
MASNKFQRYELAAANSVAPGRSVAAVSRVPGSMEVWWIAPNGSVQGAYWYEGQSSWKQYELAPAGSASTTGGIAAVSRVPSSLEVWWVGPDGSVQDAYWYDGGQWGRFQLAPAGSASLKGGIAAVSRIPNSMEVWWIGPDGSVQDAYWYDGGQWSRFQLAPPGSANWYGGITAVSRTPGSMEVWWIGLKGDVRGAYWYDGGQWGLYDLAPAGSASFESGGVLIAAVSRIPNSMEVFWIGGDGSVQGAYWYEGGQWTRYELSPPGSASTTGGIAATSRVPYGMEIWWTSPNGQLMDAYWYEGQDGWRQYELAPAGSALDTAGVCALSRIPDSMEIWWVGPGGSIQGAFWYDHISARVRDLHRRTGGKFGPLGALIRELRQNPDGSLVREYQLGEIRMANADAIPEAFTKFAVEVSLAAVKCFGTEDPGGEDEAYAVISLISVNPNFGGVDVLVKTTRTEIQNGVEAREVIFKQRTIGEVEAFPGSGIKIHVALFDHESGDANALRDRIQAVLNDAAKKGAQALAAAAAAGDPKIAGPVGDVIDFEIGGVKPFKLLTGGLAQLLTNILADDLIDEHEFFIPAEHIRELALDGAKFNASFRRTPELGNDVQFNWPRTAAEEVLFSGGGGSYKVYFQIVPIIKERRLVPRIP